MKLISMTDYVLGNQSASHYFKATQNYAKFLKQPLELWMFVPCDETGKPMVEPNDSMDDKGYYKKYQQAKERVLFEGCGIMDKWCVQLSNGFLLEKVECLHNLTIEDLIQFNLTLTQTAIKQL